MDHIVSAPVETAVQDVTYIIEANATPMTLTEPIVTYPKACFSVKTYEVVDIVTGLTPSWIIVAENNVSIYSQ